HLRVEANLALPRATRRRVVWASAGSHACRVRDPRPRNHERVAAASRVPTALVGWIAMHPGGLGDDVDSRILGRIGPGGVDRLRRIVGAPRIGRPAAVLVAGVVVVVVIVARVALVALVLPVLGRDAGPAAVAVVHPSLIAFAFAVLVVGFRSFCASDHGTAQQ